MQAYDNYDNYAERPLQDASWEMDNRLNTYRKYYPKVTELIENYSGMADGFHQLTSREKKYLIENVIKEMSDTIFNYVCETTFCEFLLSIMNHNTSDVTDLVNKIYHITKSDIDDIFETILEYRREQNGYYKENDRLER